MAKFNKRSIIDLNEPTPMTGGNLFEAANNLLIQKQKDLQSMSETIIPTQEKKSLMQQINDYNQKRIGDRTLNAYQLLHTHAWYFCNTCEFETEDYKLKERLKQAIRASFLYGIGGIYYDAQMKDYYACSVASVRLDPFNNITYAQILPANVSLENQSGDILSDPNIIEIKGKDCENLIIFKWGVMAFSAWYMFYRICLQEEEALKRMCALWPSFNMKYTYVVNDPKASIEELKAYWDPLYTFQVVMEQSNFSNRFETMDSPTNTNAQDFIDFYRKAMAQYYAMFGIKVNMDFKKERNVTGEVEASQDAIDQVQREWLDQFEIFIKRLNEQSWCPNVQVKEKEENDISRTDATNQPETRIEE